MRVIIIGAGIIGAATAYFAARRGHRVTVLERHGGAADETSRANAGQLSYSYTDTLASPGMLLNLPSLLRGSDLATRIRIEAALLPWGLRFLWHCSRKRSDSNTVKLLHLAVRSRAAMEALLSDIPLEFNHRTSGKLLLTASTRTLTDLQRRADLKGQHGVSVEILRYSECLATEPALADWRGGNIAGAAFAPGDAVGDAREFATRLCGHLTSSGAIELIPRTQAVRLLQHQGRIVGVDTPQGVLETDAVVICAGISTNPLLRPLGLHMPIYPLKGYSITAARGSHPPRVSITDLDRRIVFARLGERVRLAGFVDCSGYDASIPDRRIEDLLRVGGSLLPHAADFGSKPDPWAGLRPATPSGLPIVGPTRVPGLFLNVGHGGLGWTLACATAQDIAEQLSDQAAL